MHIERQEIELSCGLALAFAGSQVHADRGYVVDARGSCLHQVDLRDGQCEPLRELCGLEVCLPRADPWHIAVAPDDSYIALWQHGGRFALVVPTNQEKETARGESLSLVEEIARRRQASIDGSQPPATCVLRDGVLLLDRQDYHSEQTDFPLAFFKNDDDGVLLVHATDWNAVVVSDPATGEVLRREESELNGTKSKLDYFFGRLRISPGNSYILSSGWVWNPVSVLLVWNLQEWCRTRPNAPEEEPKFSFSIVSYYWDRALCWTGSNTLAYYYDPREEDLEADDAEELGIATDRAYIIQHDLETETQLKPIEFPYISPNEFFEARPTAEIYHGRAGLMVYCPIEGLTVMRLPEGEVLFRDPEFDEGDYNSLQDAFFCLRQSKLSIQRICD